MRDPEAFEDARKQWAKDEAGPLSDFLLPQMIGYLRSRAIVKSAEFSKLDTEIQRSLLQPSSPQFELFSVR